MAKKSVHKKIKKARATVEVKSRAYGKHTRAARGSIKKATLNNVFSENSKRLAVINPIASKVHAMLKSHAGFFKENMFWQKMTGLVHGNKASNTEELLTSIAGLELNDKYPLSRFGNVPVIKTVFKTGMQVSLASIGSPGFKGDDNMYCYDIIVLFFTAKGIAKGEAMQRSKWFNKNKAAGTITFLFDVPKQSNLYLICLRLHTGTNNVATDFLGTQGMMIAASGRVLPLPLKGT